MADGDGTTTTKPDDAAAGAASAAATPKDDPALGPAGEKALEEWKRRAREAEGKIKELEPLATKARESEEATKSEVQKAAEKLAAAERERDEATGMALRYEVAADVGLPLKMAARLRGKNKEELEEDAKELLETLGGNAGGGGTTTTRPRTNGNAGTEGAPPGGSMSDVLRAGLKAGRMTITT